MLLVMGTGYLRGDFKCPTAIPVATPSHSHGDGVPVRMATAFYTSRGVRAPGHQMNEQKVNKKKYTTEKLVNYVT